jgi:chromosome segregation ATPase
MDGWVVDILKANGLAGAFIMVLLGAIAALWLALKSKDKQLTKLHGERATEREQLVRLAENANTAGMVTANATEKRNEIMAALGVSLTAQANAVERYEDRVQSQQKMLEEKFGDFRHVVDAFGESNRTNSGLIAEVRNAVVTLASSINQLGTNVQTLLLRGK